MDASRKRRLIEALYEYARGGLDANLISWNESTAEWEFKPGALWRIEELGQLPERCFYDAKDQRFEIGDLAEASSALFAENLARMAVHEDINEIYRVLYGWYSGRTNKLWNKDRRSWNLPDDVLSELGPELSRRPDYLIDPWGRKYEIVRRQLRNRAYARYDELWFYEIVSAGPDGELGTGDDLDSEATPVQYPSSELPPDIVWYDPDVSSWVSVGTASCRA